MGALSLSATIWLLLLGQEQDLGQEQNQEQGLKQEQEQGRGQEQGVGQEQGQGQEQELGMGLGQEESRLREVLCWVHVQANYGQWIVYVCTMYSSYRWRNFLILWPHGFVRDGKTNLVLFQQLYLVITAAFLPILGIGQISQIIRGDFPQVAKLL